MLETHEQALAIANFYGLMVFPCIMNTKRPAVKEWQNYKTSAATIEEIKKSQVYGVVLNDTTLVVDVDQYKKEAKESVKRLQSFLDPCSFKVRSARGGMHYYFLKPADISISKMVKEYPGIDFLSKGCYVIGPGSVIEGKVYEIVP